MTSELGAGLGLMGERLEGMREEGKEAGSRCQRRAVGEG